MPAVTDACNILIKFILSRITTISNFDLKQLLYPLKSLCDGKSHVSSVESYVIKSLLKIAKQPEGLKNNVSSTEKDSPKSELKRSRSDLSTVILQQLTTPLGNGGITWASLNEEQSDCSVNIKFYIFNLIIFLLYNNFISFLAHVYTNKC